MAITVACGQCGSKFNASDAMRGKRGKCPKCAAVIIVGDPIGAGDRPAPQPQVVRPPAAPRPPQPAEPKTKACAFCGEQILLAAIKCKHCGEMLEPAVRTARNVGQQRAPAVHPASASRTAPQKPKRGSSSLAMSSVLLAVLAFLFCWVPQLGIVSILVALLALLIGGLGLAIARFRSPAGVGFSLAGILLSVVSLVMVAIPYFPASTVEPAAAPPIVQQAAVPAPTMQDAVLSEPAEDNAAAEPEPQWTNAQNPVQEGELRISVSRVKLDFVSIKSLVAITRSNEKSKEKMLLVSLTIENTSDSRKVDFKGFSGNDLAGGLAGNSVLGGLSEKDVITALSGKDGNSGLADKDVISGLAGSVSDAISESKPGLEDNFGNHYRQMTFGLGSTVDGQAENQSIYPGKAISDVLVFEAPIEKAKYLHLELPATAFGGTGKVRFEIPAEMIAR